MGSKGTIILASSGSFLTEGDLSFLPKPINQMKIVQVITASKSVPDTSYIERHQKRMRELNFDFEVLDIDGKNENELEKILSDKDLIMVEGGNSFYLLKAIKESGFGKVVKKMLSKGVVYMGVSAGSYVACPTIEMATWKHQNKYDHCGIVDLTAMSLVPFLVTAHYSPELKELLEDKIKTASHPVKILTDGQAILVKNGEAQLIGAGEEIVLN